MTNQRLEAGDIVQATEEVSEDEFRGPGTGRFVHAHEGERGEVVEPDGECFLVRFERGTICTVFPEQIRFLRRRTGSVKLRAVS